MAHSVGVRIFFVNLSECHADASAIVFVDRSIGGILNTFANKGRHQLSLLFHRKDLPVEGFVVAYWLAVAKCHFACFMMCEFGLFSSIS